MTRITPNFNFDGRCADAIALYEQAFHAQVDYVLRYRDADPQDLSMTLTKEQEDYVYHAEMHIGGQRIMLCDNLDVPFQTSLALSLTVTFDTAEDARRAFEILASGGQIIYPLHRTTYSSQVGVLMDRYGFRWGLMTEDPNA